MSTAMKRPLAGHAGTGAGGPTSSGPGAQRAAAGQQQQQQQQPAQGQASSQHSSPMLPSASNNSSTINGGSGGVASSSGGGGASSAAAVGGATLNTELRAQLRREREAGKATQALRQRSSSVVSSQHHSSEASRRISPKASSGKGAKSASTAAAAIGSATSSRSSSQSHHKNAEVSSHASSSHGSGQTTHQSLQPKAASHPQLHTVARDGDARAPSVHTRAATQPEASQTRMPHHHHHEHHDTPASPPLRSPPANDRERVSEHAFGVESLQAAYAAKIHELALKCRNWERYAAKLLAQSEALGVENQMLKDLQSGQEQQINALEIENRALREERARRQAGEAGRASSRLGSRSHRPPQSHSAGELAEQYARGGNATAAARALNLSLADISVPSPPRYAASNGHSFDGPACSSNLYIDERDEEDARSDLRIPTPVSSISLPYHVREQDGQMHTITKQHYSQHQHQHQHQHIQQHAPHHSVPSNKSSNNSLSEHKSRIEMVNNGRIPQLGNGGRMSDSTLLADGHGRYVQQQQQQQQQSHHPSHHRRESHLYDIVGQDAFARDDAELYAEGRPSSRMSSAARRLVECQTQTDDSNGGSARISSSSTFPPSSYVQGNALTKQALAALGRPNNALLGLGAPPASASANHLGGERSIKSSTSPTSEAQRKTSGESLDMPKRRGSPVELHDDHQGGDSNHFAGLRALEGNLQSRSGSSHSDAKTVTEDYLQGAVEQRRQLRRTSLSQQQQLMYLQAQAHQAATISSQSEVNLPFARPPSRPGSRMSNNSGANFEIRSRSRNRSRAGSSSVHDIIPVALDDVFSDGLPSAASSVFTGLPNGGVRPQQPLSANSSAQNSKQNISSSSSYNDFSEHGADENEENVAPRSTSMMNDMRPKSPTPPSSAAFHLHGQHAPEASDHSDGPSTKAGYSTDAETMSELQATPSDEDEKRGAHRRLYMKLREELNTAELTKFEKYVHRYDALEIPLHGGRGLLNRVKKLLLVSNPELRTGPLDMKKRKELAREFERIVRADERTST